MKLPDSGPHWSVIDRLQMSPEHKESSAKFYLTLHSRFSDGTSFNSDQVNGENSDIVKVKLRRMDCVVSERKSRNDVRYRYLNPLIRYQTQLLDNSAFIPLDAEICGKCKIKNICPLRAYMIDIAMQHIDSGLVDDEQAKGYFDELKVSDEELALAYAMDV